MFPGIKHLVPPKKWQAWGQRCRSGLLEAKKHSRKDRGLKANNEIGFGNSENSWGSECLDTLGRAAK